MPLPRVTQYEPQSLRTLTLTYLSLVHGSEQKVSDAPPPLSSEPMGPTMSPLALWLLLHYHPVSQ